VLTVDGRHRDFDAIVVATGFETNDFLTPMTVTGRDGKVLNEVWRDGPEACLGLTVSGFPNLFFLYGPNTNLGHSSIVMMIESQTNYVMSCLRQMVEQKVDAVDVRPEVQQRYNREMQERLAESSWASVSDSWYVHGGKVTNNWPGRTTEYRRRTRHCELDDYQLSR
jgi:cation diffusion facilitator CzcD-associated flavoprotein CzcO